MPIAVFDLLLVLCTLSLLLAAVAFHRQHTSLGRSFALFGFGSLGVLLGVLTVGYATSSRADRHFLILVTAAGFVLACQALRLVAVRWERAEQLTTTVAAILLILLPFELFPSLQIAIQESLARQLVAVLELAGHQAVIEQRDGADTELRFENSGFYYIARECTGIDGMAFFGGLLLGARTTWRRKLGGILFALVAVYVVNMLRLVFVGFAMANDWFGPYLTSDDTVQMTYYVAEVAIGQTSVVLASVAGILFVSRWIPDLLAFATELGETFATDGIRSA